MCGIAGVYAPEGEVPVAVLQTLADALGHRGPDERGRFVSGALGLAHTRLSIIDTAGGHQPFFSASGAVLVANGEIYNDLDLRAGLNPNIFNTGSDCETPLHLYERDGETYAEQLRGMYAIALYDPRAEVLLISRDRFGIKQIYYVENAQGFAFASEPHALVDAGLAGRELDPVQRAELMQMQFTTGDGTIFSEIRRVRPGETLVVSKGRIVRRLMLPALPHVATPASDADALKALDQRLRETTRAHMRSDVPFGLFLSGGIDSAALALAMSQESNNPIVALTAGFSSMPNKDETQQAKRVAERVGADHHMVDIGESHFLNDLPALAAALDDPTTDPSALPLFVLSREARRIGLKVVLSGEGADELFAGYKRYRRATWMGGLWQAKSRNRGIIEASPAARDSLAGWRRGMTDIEAAVARMPQPNAVQRLQIVDWEAWLPNNLLVKLDRCLMAHGIEGRTPYLDEAFSPFAYSLPNTQKVRGGHGKWLLRAWLDQHMPDAAQPWAKKKGFVLPVAQWLESLGARLQPLLLANPGLKEAGLVHHVAPALADSRKSQAGWNLLFYALWHAHHELGIDASGSIEDVLAVAAAK